MYLRHLSAECRSILSADMAANTRPICRPRLSRVLVDMSRQACRSTPGRYFTATWPPLGRYFTNTRPTLRSLGQLCASEFYLLYSAERGFQWLSSFFALQLRQYSCLFSSYVFSSSSLLYTTVVTFGCCSIWGLLLFSIDWTLRDMFV